MTGKLCSLIRVKNITAWILLQNSPTLVEFINAVIQNIPKEDRLAAVQVKNNRGETVLHWVGRNRRSEVVNIISHFIPLYRTILESKHLETLELNNDLDFNIKLLQRLRSAEAENITDDNCQK